jgi:hypothetical protein
MKIANTFAISVVIILSSAAAQADVSKMVGTWNGSGAVFSLDGEKQADYALQMVDTLQSDGSVSSRVDIQSSGAPDEEIDLTLKNTPNGVSMSSSHGSGGMVCVEKGLCEGYFGDANGNGVAMTLILDSPDHFRSLKTELEGFKAVRLFSENYTRVSNRQ